MASGRRMGLCSQENNVLELRLAGYRYVVFVPFTGRTADLGRIKERFPTNLPRQATRAQEGDVLSTSNIWQASYLAD
jgi:hypothetical protein